MLNDPLGHRLLQSRISQLTQIIQSMLTTPSEIQIEKIPKYFNVTGIGSSEAHGRFFTHLINHYSDSIAIFQNLSNFYISQEQNSKLKEITLVVFTQGISPNSLLAINQRHLFKGLILFTSTTEFNSHPTKIKLLKILKSEGHTIIHFPLENEYTLLIRIIGPMAGYLAAIKFLKNGKIPSCNETILINTLQNAKHHLPSNALDILNNMKKGSILLVPPYFSNYAQNLAYKFLEGLFLPMPTIVNFLDFSHGYFQQLITDPKPIIILKDPSDNRKLYQHIQSMLKTIQTHIMEIPTTLPSPWNILELEAIINYLILEAVEKWGINQIDWPGKNLDKSLYEIDKPQT